jgi:hypothetical protein
MKKSSKLDELPPREAGYPYQIITKDVRRHARDAMLIPSIRKQTQPGRDSCALT